MTLSQIVFYVIASFVLGMAVLSVTSKQIFRSAIWLLLALIGIAGLYFWMEVEFIAAVQIVVYVGGIVVLIIFSIFLTQQSGKDMPEAPLSRKLAALGAALFGVGFAGTLLYQSSFLPSPQSFNNEVSRIGERLLHTGKDGFALPFEAVSMLLLAAMVACIAIAMRLPKPENKTETRETKTSQQKEVVSSI
jgi:NADH-quinone oxidoreductase subunit J